MPRYNNRRDAKDFRPDHIIAETNHGDEPRQLFAMLQQMLPERSRTALKSLLRYGHVRLREASEVRHDTLVEPGMTLEVNLTRPFVIFSGSRLSLVYEDDDIVVINKGYGLLSMGTGSSTHDKTAYSIVRDYVKKVHPSNKIFIVHRLDRDTSGLMMFAKSAEAKETLQHNWNNMVLERNYVAVLEGVVKDDEGVVKSYLDENSRFEVYSTKEKGRGKLAVTRYKVLRRGGGYTLVDFSLDTGRKNQIRVHASDMGHPIVGDRKYAADRSPIHRLALHARTLKFVHPVTRKVMSFELPVPSRFAGLVKYGYRPDNIEDNNEDK